MSPTGGTVPKAARISDGTAGPITAQPTTKAPTPAPTDIPRSPTPATPATPAWSRRIPAQAPTVAQWINRGWLRATPRTESIDPLHGGVGDRGVIKPQAVRDFVFTHFADHHLGLGDKDWFLALNEGTKPTRKVLLQETCGKGSTNETYSVAGDYAECV